MKPQISILFATCLLFAISANAQEPSQTKTTTTTTTTTDENTGADTVVVIKADEAEQRPEATSDWKGFHVGAIVQATFTDIKFKSENSALSTSYVVGYGAGGFLGYFFSSHIEVRAEALYSSLAQEIVYNDTKRDLNLSYMNFPLLVGFHTGYDKPFSFNVMFGPQFGFNTGSSLEGSGSEGIDTVQATVKVKPADIGIAYGAGLDFGFGPEKLIHLNVGFRGVYGIVDISDSSNNTTTSNYYILDRSKLMTYSGYAGVSFKF